MPEGPATGQFYYARVTFSEAKFKPHALAIGQASLAWNSLNESLGTVFWTVAGGSMLNWQPLAIWQSMTLDRPKRAMLLAAIEKLPPKFSEQYPRARDDIKWLCDETTNLEDLRNNVIHSPLTLTVPVSSLKTGLKSRDIVKLSNVALHYFHLNQRANRMTNKDILEEYKLCRDTALVLRNFSAHLFSVFTEENVSWPHRPRLPRRPGPKITQPRRTCAAKPSPPPQSSQA